MREVDISIVAYQPDLVLLQQLLDSLAEPTREPLRRNVFIQDNSPDAGVAARIAALPPLAPGAGFERVDVKHSGANLGFGRGHNANAARGAAPFLLVLNQDCILEPGVLDSLLCGAAADPEEIGAWELRQIPYEHPKAYDPVTLDTPWASGAAVLLRRKAFDSVAGFEPRIFMYGEDVDLSWRLRAKGWRVVYRPRLAVVHRTYREAGEVKPLQVIGGVLTNLCLRARYGGVLRTLEGLVMLAAEILAPRSFRGRRRGLAKAGLVFLMRWPYFLLTSVLPTEAFHPQFSGWGYEVRRDGAFTEFASRRENPDRARPRVSILVRTADRPAWLREALRSCANQTYENLEVVVIEDGAENCRAIVAEFSDRLAIRYRSTGTRMGRARAGNLALAEATGEWLNFLDDDDLLFADHVEVLIDAVQRTGAAGAYALAWETQTEFLDRQHARYHEIAHITRHHQPFDRITLWHHNYLPIQAVMFNRRLWERHGGFDEDMDQLEDWNLWTRYTLEDDFVLVPKTTSKYRVPANARIAAERQALLDKAYADALERQGALVVTLSPREISKMADSFVRSQTVMMVTRSDLRRFVGATRFLAWLASYRHPARRALRRLRLIP
jgi:GT2 family glycosyltransferase